MKKIILAIAALALAAPLAHAAELKGAKLLKLAKVSPEQAEATALKARPGVVTDRELEKEKGGLRFSFDIKGADGRPYEVGVDARTGKLLENALEGKNPD